MSWWKCPQYPESAIIGENLERYNLDGEPFVFEWEISPGHSTTQLLHEIQKLTEKEGPHHICADVQ